MRGLVRTLGAVLFVSLLAAHVALAQTEVNDGKKPRGQLGVAAGTAIMDPADSSLWIPRGTQGKQNVNVSGTTFTPAFTQNIINNPALTLTARSDSSLTGVLLTGYQRSAAVVFNAQLDSTTSAARIAISIRGSYTSAVDTSSTYPWWKGSSDFSTATNDTALAMVGAVGDSITPGSGEIVWTVKPFTTAAGVNHDLRKFTVSLFGNNDGAPFPYPYVSVRVRLLHLNGGGKRVWLRAGVMGY